MEEVAEGLFRGIARLIKWIIIDILIQLFIHGYGYVTLKVLTLGKYPKPNTDNEGICIITGLISIAATIGVIAYLN